MSAGETLPRLLRRNAQTMATATAMREKRHGIWQSMTWAEHDAATLALARGLAALGFKRGDRLALIGDNRADLYRAELAAMCLGGIAVPCWPDAGTDWLSHVLADSAVSIVVAEDQDQVEKLLEIMPGLPGLREIIYTDPRGVHHEDLTFLRSVRALAALGENTGNDVAAAIAAGTGGEVCLRLYVSGAEGAPRGVDLSHADLIAAAAAVQRVDAALPSDEYLAYLPMAWVGEAIYGTALALQVGFACSCPEDPETARRDLRELGPTILLAPPRIWQSLMGEILSKAVHATPLKRRLCASYLPPADGGAAGGGVLAEWLVRRPVRDQLGLGRLRWAHTGGLALPAHLQAFFAGLGVALRPGGAMEEVPALAALATDLPVPGTRLDGTGFDAAEIEAALRRSPFLADAVVPTDAVACIAALIAPDTAALGEWAQDRSLAYSSPAELIALPDVSALIEAEVRAANTRLAPELHVRRYALLPAVPAASGLEASLSRVLQRRIALEAASGMRQELFAATPGKGVREIGATPAREQAA
jgi:long-chain acyl-CoA synthetase